MRNFQGVCYCLAPLHSGGVADGKKLLVFLKAQEAGVRGERGGERGGGAEAERAATQLSDISSQTERRHLRHSCQAERKQDYFAVFVLDYSLLDILLSEILSPLASHHFTTR